MSRILQAETGSNPCRKVRKKCPFQIFAIKRQVGVKYENYS
jgi:hypothetical protein